MAHLAEQTGRRIRALTDVLAERTLAQAATLLPRNGRPLATTSRQNALNDVTALFDHLAEAFLVNEPRLFAAYAGWAKVVYHGRGYSRVWLSAILHAMDSVLQEALSPRCRPLAGRYLHEAQSWLPTAPATYPPYIVDCAPHAALARAYLDALLAGERARAEQAVLDAVRAGVAAPELYLHVLQPAMWEIGRLWQQREAEPSHEHFCAAVTRRVMARLAPLMLTASRRGLCVVAACVAGEWHDVGARMVADFFEMDGWEVRYLGANTPTASILRALDEYPADVLALSVGVPLHAGAAARLIQEVRAACPDPPGILVGGYACRLIPSLWQRLGADAFAADAGQAVTSAHRLVTRRARPHADPASLLAVSALLPATLTRLHTELLATPAAPRPLLNDLTRAQTTLQALLHTVETRGGHAMDTGEG